MIEQKLEEHRLLAIQLKDIKDREMTLRLELVDLLVEDNTPKTYKVKQDGYLIKVIKKVNYTLDEDTLKEYIDAKMLSDDELDLLKVKHSLSLAAYKKSNFDTTALEEAIIVKPAAPTLTIELGE